MSEIHWRLFSQLTDKLDCGQAALDTTADSHAGDKTNWWHCRTELQIWVSTADTKKARWKVTTLPLSWTEMMEAMQRLIYSYRPTLSFNWWRLDLRFIITIIAVKISRNLITYASENIINELYCGTGPSSGSIFGVILYIKPEEGPVLCI